MYSNIFGAQEEAIYVPVRKVDHYNMMDFVLVCETYKNADFTYQFLGVPKKNFIGKASHLDCYYPETLWRKGRGRKALNPEYNEDVPGIDFIWDENHLSYKTNVERTDEIISTLKKWDKGEVTQEEFEKFTSKITKNDNQQKENEEFKPEESTQESNQTELLPLDDIHSKIVEECTAKVLERVSQNLTQSVVDSISLSLSEKINSQIENQLKTFQISILNSLPTYDPLDSLIESLINFKTNSLSNFKDSISEEEQNKLALLNSFDSLVNTDEFKAFQQFSTGQSEEFAEFCKWKTNPPEPKVVEKVVEKIIKKEVPKVIERQVPVADKLLVEKAVAQEMDKIAARKGYPTKAQFLNMMNKYENYAEIARNEKVTPATVRSWAKFHGIESMGALKLQGRA